MALGSRLGRGGSDGGLEDCTAYGDINGDGVYEYWYEYLLD